ncbi:hypothetical protein [Bacillus sp. 1P06AnD]|uniref:hypothetical protein n=1 Tax=Bacillus sp. 1P06AnD TaxID=3132208 RepID=UPI0039A2EE6E
MMFLKLLDFEMKRIWKLFACLTVLLLIVQPIAAAVRSLQYLNRWNEASRNGDFIEQVALGRVTQNVFFYFPFVLIILGLLIYTFLIWYRDWYGKNNVAYTLLMLPGNRMNLFFAKVVSIIVYFLCAVVIQMAMYFIVNPIFKWIIPVSGRLDGTLRSWIGNDPLFYIIVPVNVTNFLFLYILGISLLLVIFTGILLERSYGMKGIILTALYVLIAFGFIILPFVIHSMVITLYPAEMKIIYAISVIVIIVSAIAISTRLINKKVTV